jgi:hypothetical protein
MDNFELPAFLRKSFDMTDSAPQVQKSTSRKQSKAIKVTPLALLQTFESSAQEVLAPQRFVRKLEALDLPDDLTNLIGELTAILGAATKAWAVVLQWLAERLVDQITLSRQSERLLRNALKDEAPELLQKLKLTWSANVDAISKQELAT